MRVFELLAVKESDVKWDISPIEVSLKAEYTKGDEARKTFLTSEAVATIKEWLKVRDDWIATQKARTSKYHPNDSIFPISESSFSDLWLRAVKNVGLDLRDDKTKRLRCHPHGLRKWFRTYGKWELPDVAECLMGHTSGMEAIYARLDQAEPILREGYLKAEPHLSLSASVCMVTELKAKVEDDKLHFKTLEENLRFNNEDLQNQLYKIKADLPKMIDLVVQPYIDTVNQLLERLGAVPQEN